MNIKKGMAISLALCITLSPMLAKAENEDIVPISAPISVISEGTVKETEYIHFAGKIEEIQAEGDHFSILVKNEKEDDFNELRAYVSKEVILLNDKDMNFAKKEDLKVGTTVTMYYYKHKPMGLSLPPVLTPDAIVINNADNENFMAVMVSKFDKDLLNAEKDLVIHVSDKTVIVDKDGNKVDKDELTDEDLIIFYDIVLESYPAQTHPKKIVVLEKEEPVVAKEFLLKKEFIKTIDGVTMIPLRLVGESLGYKVSWNEETKTAELLRGPQWNAVTLGEDNYNFAKMIVKLGTAPVLINSSTYVPLNYAEQVLIAEVEAMDNGDIKLKY